MRPWDVPTEFVEKGSLQIYLSADKGNICMTEVIKSVGDVEEQ